jgi:hypothetical protein
MLFMLLYVLIGTYLAVPMAYWVQSSKNMGYWWALFFCITLTPVGCYILAKLSGDKSEEIVLPLFTQVVILMNSFLAPAIAAWMVVAGFLREGPFGWVLVLAGTGLAGASLFGVLLVFRSRADDEL